MPTLDINGEPRTLDVPDDMPLLWVLRDVVGLTGTKFGCGISMCGACTVHVDGQAIRSCVTPIAAVAGNSRKRAVCVFCGSTSSATAARSGCSTPNSSGGNASRFCSGVTRIPLRAMRSAGAIACASPIVP